MQTGFHLTLPGASQVGISVLTSQGGTEKLISLPKATVQQVGLERRPVSCRLCLPAPLCSSVTHTLQPVGIKKQEMKHTAPNSEIRIQRPKSPEENTDKGGEGGGVGMGRERLWGTEGRARKESGESEKVHTLRLDSALWRGGSSEASSGPPGTGDRAPGGGWALGVCVTCGFLALGRP